MTDTTLPITWVHTLILGSGAAGLNAAVQLRAHRVDDLLIVTEGLQMGTSINTGADKQTYYKLSLCGDQADSPRMLAETYFNGGGMHGDLALVEAALSARAFLHLVDLGVPFPRDAFGQFIGYKTDHDPRQRATSIGPYTSQEMCRALIRRVEELEIPVRENANAVQLLTVEENGSKRIAGAIVINQDGQFEAIGAENVVFAVGGPGGLYKTSVYPKVHTGAIGLALQAGAMAQNLPESQFGMASIKYRWNVSGTYMQVVPRLISTDQHGGDEREFLLEYFDKPGEMNSRVFLKGYQWPFDSRKVIGGSSLVDILVYIETVLKSRRVFLDYRRNPEGFSVEQLSEEAREYLVKSNALQETPLERLRAMNPQAIEHYAAHGIDLGVEPLEIAVCAQHNNGGLAANHWWESVNVKHLFPVGEVNGSHGVYRPGGSALNSGQVGGFRAAEYIAARYADWSIEKEAVRQAANEAAAELTAWAQHKCPAADRSWQQERDEFQQRMSRAGAHIRSAKELRTAVTEARQQAQRIETQGCRYTGKADLVEALRNRQLCLAHAVYLQAVRFAVESGVGSRGSAMTLDSAGAKIHPKLDDAWHIAPPNDAFEEKVLETSVGPGGDAQSDWDTQNRWVDRRRLPESELWFETAWARFRDGSIYGE